MQKIVKVLLIALTAIFISCSEQKNEIFYDLEIAIMKNI